METSGDLAQSIRTVFDELDAQQLKIFARHSPTRRLEMMFDLCEFSRQMIIASERQRDPGVDDAELARRVKVRIELVMESKSYREFATSIIETLESLGIEYAIGGSLSSQRRLSNPS